MIAFETPGASDSSRSAPKSPQEESEAAEADVESIARRVAREELHRT